MILFILLSLQPTASSVVHFRVSSGSELISHIYGSVISFSSTIFLNPSTFYNSVVFTVLSFGLSTSSSAEL